MTREAIVNAALHEWQLGGSVGFGHPRVRAYWRAVLPPEWDADAVELYASAAARKHWCGAFALHAWKVAGIADNIFWHDGRGFVRMSWLTRDPQPGDVAYRQKHQHHAIVKGFFDRDGVRHLVTIDGNTPGISQRWHTTWRGLAFFSAGPALQACRADNPSDVR